MEWQAPAIVLAVREYGEGDAIATVLGAEVGTWRGLARGGGARGHAAVWQPGNLIAARWLARLADQLGSLTAELVHPGAALAMEDPITLAVLAAACAVGEGALPEREPHPAVFEGLLRLIVALPQSGDAPAALARWERGLLAALGYGLDLDRCAVTGATDNLTYVSPKSGRTVSAGAAGRWRERLLPLPGCLRDEGSSGPAEWRDALRITGHFLERDAFGVRHRPLPAARLLLYDRVAALAARDSETARCPMT
jgi:DNA repair protein RecO (recombination protein O)